MKSGEPYLLNVEPYTTMQEVTTKLQEEGGLQLSQVNLNMVKNLSKGGHHLTHYLLEEISENIPVEVESGHKKGRIIEANYYINQVFEKTKLAKLNDDIVSVIKTQIRTVIMPNLIKLNLQNIRMKVISSMH